MERAAGLGMPVEAHVASGRIAITALEPTEISPGEFATRIIRAMESGARLVVIDSLNGFTKAMPEESQLTVKIHELLSYLGSHGVTTLLTLAQRGIFGAPPDDATDVSYLADAVILLRYFEALGEVRQAISVLKKRSGAHEQTIREYRIRPGGLQVGEPLRDFQGVLTGVPHYLGAAGPLLDRVDEGAGESA
jgi:circadian clock protein KaiC